MPQGTEFIPAPCQQPVYSTSPSSMSSGAYGVYSSPGIPIGSSHPSSDPHPSQHPSSWPPQPQDPHYDIDSSYNPSG